MLRPWNAQLCDVIVARQCAQLYHTCEVDVFVGLQEDVEERAHLLQLGVAEDFEGGEEWTYFA